MKTYKNVKFLLFTSVCFIIVLFLTFELDRLAVTPFTTTRRLLFSKPAETGYMRSSVDDQYSDLNAFHISSNASAASHSLEIRDDEVRHIGFLKVHKAGSTTMQNLFFRFGLKRNLNFVIPKRGNYFRMPSVIPVKKGEHYDILAIHTIFNKTNFDKVLPADKVNIGIVREPLEVMISAAYYYLIRYRLEYLVKVPKPNFIQELIDHPDNYEVKHFSHTRNSMGEDFGFNASVGENDTSRIQQKLKFLEAEFKLVLILERFEESLVLMKRYLRWMMSDIVFIPSNTNRHGKVNLTDAHRAKHKRTSFLDYAIYDFFSKSFEVKVQAEGPLFQEEVTQFKNVLKQTKSFCGQSMSDNDTLDVPPSDWNSAFMVSHADCELMKLGELKFIDKLRKRHVQMNRMSDK